MKNLLYLIFSMSFLTSYTNKNNPSAVSIVAETKIDIAYGKDSLQRMDIYLPAGRTTDLTTMYTHPWHSMIPQLLKMITGTTLSANPDLYKQYSPVNFVTPDSPPTIILQGDVDYVVNPSQSKLLKNKLDEAGVVSK